MRGHALVRRSSSPPCPKDMGHPANPWKTLTRVHRRVIHSPCRANGPVPMPQDPPPFPRGDQGGFSPARRPCSTPVPSIAATAWTTHQSRARLPFTRSVKGQEAGHSQTPTPASTACMYGTGFQPVIPTATATMRSPGATNPSPERKRAGLPARGVAMGPTCCWTTTASPVSTRARRRDRPRRVDACASVRYPISMLRKASTPKPAARPATPVATSPGARTLRSRFRPDSPAPATG